MRHKLIASALLAMAITTISAGFAKADPHDIVVLQGLDKVTARVSTLKAIVGESIRFGTLEIITRQCDKRPPEATPESAAFVDIWELQAGEAAVSVFRGWMFASSPAVSALEHPVYDVWVIDCENRTPIETEQGGDAGQATE